MRWHHLGAWPLFTSPPMGPAMASALGAAFMPLHGRRRARPPRRSEAHRNAKSFRGDRGALLRASVRGRIAKGLRLSWRVTNERERYP